MLFEILLAGVAAVALLLLAVATRPETFRLQRSITIAAPAEVVFAQLADLRRWTTWNPFEKLDPAARVTHAGAPGAVGSSYHFAGRKMGEGRMTTTAIVPYERVVVRAEFVKPFRATNTIEFTLAPAADGVAVTWAMYGPQTLMGKALSLVMSMDRVMGPNFEAGLADLARVSEEEAGQGWASGTSRRERRPTPAD